MTENKRFRMETIGDIMLPFIVDNSTAKKKSDTTTTYHTYETHRKEKCLELVDLLNNFSEENEQLKKQLASINRLIDNKIDEFKKGDYGDLPCNTIHMFLDLKQELGDLE